MTLIPPSHAQLLQVYLSYMVVLVLIATSFMLPRRCQLYLLACIQHVVVTEYNGHRVTVFSSTGEVVRRFYRFVSAPSGLCFPLGVAGC